MCTEQEIQYRCRPYVCGALGRWDATVLHRLLAASPAGLDEAHTCGAATLWSTSGLHPWTAGQRRGYFWAPLAGGPLPTSLQDAAGRRLAAGLVIDDQEATLHTCALGMQELYIRRLGDALYFAVRIDPLLNLADAPLHTDWSAWASILALAGPLGDSTPFQEVRRVVAATAWSTEGCALEQLRFDPSWLHIEPHSAPSAAEIVELVSQQIPAGSQRRTAVALSGGWDSRLLASIAQSRSPQRLLAWTTSPDDGIDLDIKYARSVAKTLGMDHRVVAPGPEAWVEERLVVWHRVQHQTWMHTWAMPLARRLHRRPERLLDGLAGDVLLKSFLVDHEVAHAQGSTMRKLLWTKLSGGRLDVPQCFAPGVAETFEDASRADFDDATSHLDEHPAAPALAVLLTRTARAIASSPTWAFGPEADVLVPFVHPDVITTALRVPVTAKIGGGFYRDVLASASADVAALPSTNDPGPEPFKATRRATSPTALMAMADAIRANNEVHRLLGPRLQRALTDAEALAQIWRRPRVLRILQWASMFADWQSAHRTG